MAARSAIIVAGGSGSRMQSDVPKQFIRVLDKPLLIYTLEVFLAFDPDMQIILVLPKDHFSFWKQMKKEFLPTYEITVVPGGSSRYQSVSNGLRHIQEGLVAIHDAVRPLVTTEIIQHSFESAEKTGSGVVTMPLKDSLRKINAQGSEAVDRNGYCIVQTPQTFRVELIKKAFESGEQPHFTDDASVFEEVLGQQVTLVEGSYENFKVTTPEDLLVMEALVKKTKL